MEVELLTQENIQEIAIEVVERFLRPHFEAEGLEASGETSKSINARTEPNKAIFFADASIDFAINGRGPNVNQDEEYEQNWVKWYAPNVFAPWIETRGLSMDPYALAYGIARYGSQRYRDNDPSRYLDILHSEELKRFVKERIGIFVKANTHAYFLPSLNKLRRS